MLEAKLKASFTTFFFFLLVHRHKSRNEDDKKLDDLSHMFALFFHADFSRSVLIKISDDENCDKATFQLEFFFLLLQ